MTPPREQIKSVLVAYDASPQGDAALSYALEIALAAGATLTVTCVAPQERTDVGCAHCRASARAWNERLRLLAHERLARAANAIGDSPAVHYLAACGPERHVLAQAARQREADIVVLPWRRAERLRRLLRLSSVEDLSRRGPWNVVLAPRTAASPRRRREPAVPSSTRAPAASPRSGDRQAPGTPPVTAD
jgi:nucleotide-binding universal stress UspA family protein